jgi:hypothetical protein
MSIPTETKTHERKKEWKNEWMWSQHMTKVENLKLQTLKP